MIEIAFRGSGLGLKPVLSPRNTSKNWGQPLLNEAATRRDNPVTVIFG